MTTLDLTFNGVELSTITHNNQIWMTSIELAKALGYAGDNGVRRIYNRNKDEFTETMSTVLPAGQNGTLGESSGLQRKVRYFSLRGCHMIAFFASTKIAKQFRVWVLDILDKEVGEPKPYGLKQVFTCPFANQAQPAKAQEPLEKVSAVQLRKIKDAITFISINCRFEASAKWNFEAVIREKFEIKSIDDLPAKHFDEVVERLGTVKELAQKHYKIACDADREFVKSVISKGIFELPPVQYGLLA